MDENTKIDSGIDISFFVPCLNEEKNICDSLNVILSATKETDVSYEVLVVDDHSTDRTIAVVEEFMRQHPDMPVRIIKNERINGLGRNYVDTSYHANGKHYMMVTGDNSLPEKSLVTFLYHMGEADMIVPNYAFGHDQRTFLRKLISESFTKLVNILSGYSLKYYNGETLHLRRNVVRWHSDTNGFGYQAELLTRLLDEGFSCKEITMANNTRTNGSTSAFKIQNIFAVCHSLLQILFRRMRKELFYRKRS